jgi:hypothetical protein
MYNEIANDSTSVCTIDDDMSVCDVVVAIHVVFSVVAFQKGNPLFTRNNIPLADRDFRKLSTPRMVHRMVRPPCLSTQVCAMQPYTREGRDKRLECLQHQKASADIGVFTLLYTFPHDNGQIERCWKQQSDAFVLIWSVLFFF